MPNVSSSKSEGAPRLGEPLAARVALGIGLGALVLLGFLPQFGGPGYEASLAAGVVLPGTAAAAAALMVGKRRLAPGAAVARGLYLGAALALLGFAITVLHGLRVGICDFAEGSALFMLGPAPGALLGGVTGAYAGLVMTLGLDRAPRRTAPLVALALSLPVASVIVSLLRFYTSPMVFAYDPYAGYFSGPLYDTVIGALVPLATYRLGTLATILALIALASLLVRRDDGSLDFIGRSRRNVAFGGAVALLASATVTAFGPELGHYNTADTIRRALGRTLTAGRCEVIYSSSIPEADARRLGRECNAHLAQIERFFETTGPDRVLVYLFASDAEKGRLMGAARTYIAKPWRNEVYVQAAGYPHPVLGHELAHVVAGSFGSGPFHVSGPLGGWIPDPGRIEGVATAAAPDENDALTLEEWAAAMRRLNLLPELKGLFRLSFLGQNAARAYTASGAFLRFLRAEHGASAVRRWYAGESLESATGSGFENLEKRWHAALDSFPLSDPILATARARFERPAFFARRCPRVIDRVLATAAGRLGIGDTSGARESYQEVLQLDPGDSSARLGLALCAARRSRVEEATTRYEALARAADAAPWAKLAALEGRADLLLRVGKTSEAKRTYDELASLLVDEDRLRTLDVKRLATAGILREAIVTLLIGEALGPSWDAAAPLLGEHAALTPAEGLASYLIGRNLMARGRLEDAARHLDRAVSRELPEARVLPEALRLRVVIACALSDRRSARSALDRFFALPLPAARRQGMSRFAERCGIDG